MKGPRSEAGLALLTALLITAILVAVIAEFTFRIYIGSSRAEVLRDSVRASVAAADGVEIARAGVEEFIRKDPYIVMEAQGLSFVRDIDGITVEINIMDERSKVSARVVYPKTGLADEKVEDEFGRLLRTLGLDERLKDSLADWIDADDTPRPYGAEGPDYYAKLRRPYMSRNALPASVDELLLVKGFTPEAHGALSPHVTVFINDGLVNINTAPDEVIKSLADGIDDELASRLIERRKKTPFKDKSDVMKVPGFETLGFRLQDRITVRSAVYSALARARAGDAVYEIESVFEAGGRALYWRER